MPDLATLGIRIENGDVVKATTSIDALAAAGARAEASTKKHSAATSQLTDSTRSMTLTQMRAIEMYEELKRKQELANHHTSAWSVLQQEASGHVGSHSLAIGRLAKNLEHVAAEALGVNESLALGAASFSKFAVGEIELVAGLAALAAVAYAWDKITEASREAEKAQNEAIKAANDRARGELGKVADELSVLRAAQVKAQKHYDDIRLGKGVAGMLAGGYGFDTEEKARNKLTAANNALKQAEKELTEAMEAGSDKRKDKREKEAREIEKAEREREAAAQKIIAEERERQSAMAKSANIVVEALKIQSLHSQALREGADLEGRLKKILTDKNLTLEQQIIYLTDLHKVQAALNADATRQMGVTPGLQGRVQITDLLQQAQVLASLKDLLAKPQAISSGTSLMKKIGEEAKEQAKIVDALLNQIQRDFAHFFESVFTDGLKSFGELFSNIRSMFTKLLADMAAAQVRKKAESAIKGVISDVGLGASLGIGAAVAGISLFVSAILGAGNAARKAAEDLRNYKTGLNEWTTGITGTASQQSALAIGKQIEDQLQKWLDATGQNKKVGSFNGDIDALMKFLDELAAFEHNAELDQLVKTAHALIDSSKRAAEATKQESDAADEAAKAQLALAEAQRIATAAAYAEAERRGFEDLNARSLAAHGDVRGAQDAQLNAQQRQEMADAIAAGRSNEYLDLLHAVQGDEKRKMLADRAMEDATKNINDALAETNRQLDAQLATAEAALKINQDQLRVADQNAQATQKVVDTLKEFSDSLKLDTSLTTLSPVQQLVEAQRQYDEQLARAQGGDRDAASGLPGSAQALLNASRAVNASGMGYVADFQHVQSTIAAIKDQYGTQFTTEQEILKTLQAQSMVLQQQIEAVNAAKAQAAADAARSIAYLSSISNSLVVFASGVKPPNPGGVTPITDARSISSGDPTAVMQAQVNVLQEGFTQLLAETKANTAAVQDVARQVKRSAEVL